MLRPNDGPSDNAWGIDLVDPVIVTHQQRLVLFARARDATMGTLYFRVLDPSTASLGDDLAAWNGWYRYRFPEEAAASRPANAEEAAAIPARELRLAGMDLLTVPPVAEPVSSAKASFRVLSDGNHLSVYRQSTSGTVLLSRLALLAGTEDVGGTRVDRYALEPAWEVRFRRSGLRDVPVDDLDSQSYLDPVDHPFYEPTIEFARVSGVADGRFDVARVPTLAADVSILYFAVATPTGVALHQVRQSGTSLVDHTETPAVYPPITPTLRTGDQALTPIAGLAPALVFYAEHEAASTDAGNEAELQRAGHLMLALPVSGEGLSAALAVYDFTLDRDGNIAALAPGEEQSLLLVDGTLTGGTFTPDTTSPAFPRPADLAGTVQVVDVPARERRPEERLVVSSMLLGQVQPTRSPVFHFGDDGLVHLYYGGPPPTPPFDRWSSLDPELPQAMVAQFDARANRLVVTVPWQATEIEEEGDGVVELVALQSGVTMTGATVTVGDGGLRNGSPAPDLCTVAVAYPPASKLPAETWYGVPRSLGPFMDVLNGAATDDSADPAALAGNRQFYDYAGTRPLARPALTLPSGVDLGPPPTMTVVSTRDDLPLASVEVSAAGGGTQAHTFRFAPPAGAPVTVTWRAVPADPATFADVFDGAAAPQTYGYPPDPDGTPLFALATDAVGIPAPVVLYSVGSNPGLADLTIAVTAAVGGTLDVAFSILTHPITGVPAEVDEFVAHLRADAAFQGLGLGISADTAAGKVATTTDPTNPAGPVVPVTRMDLGTTGTLFDVLMPAIDLTGATVAPATYAAGRQGHTFDPDAAFDRTRMAGFLATSLRPSSGATAYVTNTVAGDAEARPSRSLHAHGDADPLVSGLWIRQSPQWQCHFAQGDNATVPVAVDGVATTASANLRPQWDWTLEAWLRPDAGGRQQVVTFRDAETPQRAGAPALAYSVAVESQQIVRAEPYVKTPVKGDSSYFQTGTSVQERFMPAVGFTWEVWVKPDAQAAPLPPLPADGTVPIGGVVQLGQAQRKPFLRVGLTADRHVQVITVDGQSAVHVHTSSDTVPAVDESGVPAWSHLALVGEQDATDQLWTFRLMVDADVTDTFDEIELQDQQGAFLIIGANTQDDSTLFGSLAQLRYWSHARTPADIRRTWLTSMSGTEPGLVGNWPLSAIETKGDKQLVANTAAATGTDWDADLYERKQQVHPVDDSFFLSVVASVGGLPAVEADALLANGRWNHLALVYQAGGALDMNPAAAFDGGRRDWVDCGNADTIAPAERFAIDAWVRVPTDVRGPVGTVLARWATDDDPDSQSFRYWIDDAGEMNVELSAVADAAGSTKPLTARSTGAALRDGTTHHVAVVLSSTSITGDNPSVDWVITFYKDKDPVGVTKGNLAGVNTIELRASQSPVTIGCACAPIPGGEALPEEDFAFLRATLGEVRVWGTAPPVEALFPEKFPRNPRRGAPAGLAARWSFREQTGRITLDTIGDLGATLSNSAMRTTLMATSTLGFVANGAWVGRVTPATTGLPDATRSQFTLGTPLVSTGTAPAGLTGEIAEVALYDEARSIETIQDQMYVPRWGSETSLIACWNFARKGADITGGLNDITTTLGPDRVTSSTAPLSIEGPYVRNVYGGLVNDHSQSTPGRIAVGSYADAQFVGTADQRAVLKRQYVVDPDQTPARAIQIGELGLVYLGQVQTDPTLIGYIEGAPPVPGENLTRPYWLSGIAWANYMDTTTVTLVHEAAETVTFTSSSSHATQIESSAAIGLFGTKTNIDYAVAAPFMIITSGLSKKTMAQAKVTGSGKVGGGSGETILSTWGAAQRDLMGVSGDWEPHQPAPAHYLDKGIGRRFVVDNGGYALVESLTADLYALTFRPTGASVGTIVLPNPAIPPDRNVIVFPMKNDYSRNGTLDGKVGLANDPAYPGADIRRGSLFKPVEGYAMAARIERQHERAKSVADQFDPERKAHGWDTSLDDARGALSQDFSTTPRDAVVATPTQGLVNRYVWTADGGLHAEEQSASSSTSRSYTGDVARGGGGGFHAEGEFFLKVGWAWSFDVMATHQVDVTMSKESADQQGVHLEVKAAGDALLRTFDPDAPAEPGPGKGAFKPGLAPGKVKTYRFMTIYLPPSTTNSRTFASIVDPVWLRMSNDASARALRQLDAGSPTWRVLHRVTYVERIPPPASSRPLFSTTRAVTAPVNVEGNAELIRLVDAQIPTTVTERTRLIVGNAVTATLNPAAKADKSYPPSALEQTVPWWRTFLDRARPVDGKPPTDAEAAQLLHALVSRTTTYLLDGYASRAFDDIL